MSFAVIVAHLYRLVAPIVALTLLPLFGAMNFLVTVTKRVPPFNPRGKVILITGASSGIGADLALRYAQGGAKLILCARRKKELEEVSQKCLKAGAQNVWIETVDITNETEFKNIIESHGNANLCLDMIVLNAGIAMNQLVRNCNDTSIFRKIMDLNYTACVAGFIYSLPYLKAAVRPKVVVINSAAGFIPTPLLSGYNASKFALKGFIDALRMEEPTIDFTSIYPGPVATEITEKMEGGRLDTAKFANFLSFLSLSDCTDLIVDAVNRGARDEVFGFWGGNVMWFAGRWSPAFFDAFTAFVFGGAVDVKVDQRKRD